LIRPRLAGFEVTGDILTNASWIVTSNGIVFGVQLNPASSNPVGLIVTPPAPTNITSFSSDGTCHVSWADASSGTAAGFRIYARREDESLFQLLGTTTNVNYDTGYPWETGDTGTNWFFAVVAVTTNDVESPYADVVMNAAPAHAAFTADVLSGTPPLTVSFTNQSLGNITNWAWDFDSDGTIDSMETNLVVTYAEPGTYSVTLSVAGPDGTDMKVAVGYITVWNPELSLQIQRLSSNQFRMTITGNPGQVFTLQGSPDLFHWANLETHTNQTGTIVLTNAPPVGRSAYFYRTVVFAPNNSPAVPAPILTDPAFLEDGRMRFQLNSVAGTTWRLEGSPDLVY
jgi:PKD domain